MKTDVKKKTGKKILRILFLLLTAFCCFIFLMPIGIAVLTSLKSPMDIASDALGLPSSIYVDNYIQGIAKSDFLRSIRNSLIVTIPSVAFIVLFSSMGGYTIAKNGERHRFIGLMEKIYLSSLMIPFQILMIPVYKIFKSTGLINTLQGVILMEIGYSIAYATFLYIGFAKSIPNELEEAAIIDGCNYYQMFIKIAFPLLKPISSTVAALHMMWVWNDFNISLILLQKNNVRTLTIKQYYFFGEFSSNYGMAFATAILSMIPILIFFLVMQKYLVEGISAGAVKS